MLVNIIHPYTYKLSNNVLFSGIGPTEEFRERDEKVSEFVKRSIDSESKVIFHKLFDLKRPDNYLFSDLALRSDPLYQPFFDSRVNVVTTTKYGLLLQEERPETISVEDWERLRNIFTSPSQFKQMIGNPKKVVFIGGVLENCVANAANDFVQNHKKDSQEIYYVPELCVSLDKEHLEKITPKINNLGIRSISYEEALGFVSSPSFS